MLKNENNSYTLNLVGSASMQEICEELIKEFKKKKPEINVIKSGSGSGEATTAVLKNIAQIGDVSRKLLETENPNKFNKKTIAIDGIAITINKNNPISNLTNEQIQKIFKGEVVNWKEVGGPNEPIVIVGREAMSGIRSKIEEYFKTNNKTKYTIELSNDGAVKAKIQKEKNSIGYLPFSCTDETVKKIRINNTEPNERNLKNKNYNLYRTFDQITLKNQNDELVNAWFNFLKSREARRIIKKLKLIPAN